MKEFVNKLVLAGDKFMPGLHLKQPGFTFSACVPFTRNKERIEKFMQTDFIYRYELDKACFQHVWLMVNQKIQQKELNQKRF